MLYPSSTARPIIQTTSLWVAIVVTHTKDQTLRVSIVTQAQLLPCSIPVREMIFARRRIIFGNLPHFSDSESYGLLLVFAAPPACISIAKSRAAFAVIISMNVVTPLAGVEPLCVPLITT